MPTKIVDAVNYRIKKLVEEKINKNLEEQSFFEPY